MLPHQQLEDGHDARYNHRYLSDESPAHDALQTTYNKMNFKKKKFHTEQKEL